MPNKRGKRIRSRAKVTKPALRVRKTPKRGTSEKMSEKNKDHALREHLLYLLRGGGAHVNFEKVLADFPAELRGAKTAGIPFTPWKLLEHMRIAQWDILEFNQNPQHVSPDFPSGYWPAGYAPPDPTAWDKSLKAFRADLKALQKLVENPATDLFARIPHGNGQTILREALLVVDHNAYHIGQLVLIRRLFGAWIGP